MVIWALDEEFDMAVLNEELSLLPSQWAKEFIGSPERQLIAEGTKLCKRVTSSVDFNPYSQWWILKSDWDLQELRAASIGVSQPDMTRARQAVRPDWQKNLDQVVFGQILKPVYGWIGQARWQPIDPNDPRVVYIGGGRQVCIPNLSSNWIRVLHSVPQSAPASQ